MTINPYSYLIVPFAIHKDGATKFGALIDKYVGVQTPLVQEEQSTWIPGRVVKHRYKGQLYRENMVYPHFSHIFEAFACNEESGLMMPPNDCYFQKCQITFSIMNSIRCVALHLESTTSM